MAPEAVESIILAVAAGWCLYLHGHRRAGALPLFAALYLGVPAVGLGLQEMGWVELAEVGKWIVVGVNALITTTMIATTSRADSGVVRALVDAERERQRLVLRAQAETLAAVCLAEPAA